MSAHTDAPQASAAGARPARPSTLADAAVELACLELWPVFALTESKVPFKGSRGHKDATREPPGIREMFARPGAALIGVPTGEVAEFDVLDIDPRSGGNEWLAENEHRLPETRVHQTRSGGRHYLFNHHPGVRNSSSRIAPGIDVRGEGGFVVVPPSPGYSVISDADIADWPDWLLEPGMVMAPPEVERPASSVSYVPAGEKRISGYITSLLDKVRAAKDGQKHETLRNAALALGGVAAEAGFSDEEGVGWLLAALPNTVEDWKGAANTAGWGLRQGRAKPIQLEERARDKPAKRNGATPPPRPDGGGTASDHEPAGNEGDPGADAANWANNDPAEPVRPIVQIVAGNLHNTATEAEAAIRQSGLPIFQRGESLVRPIHREVPAACGKTTIAASLLEITQPSALDIMSQTARFQKWNARQESFVNCDPTPTLANVMLSRVGQWGVPRIAGVITAPTLRPDGSILSAPGYDPATSLFHVPDPAFTLPAIPDNPTPDDAERAMGILQDLLTGFPFVSAEDRAVGLSALITPVVRGAMPVAPLHAIRASTAGTGKSYLVDLASVIATGNVCPVIAAGRDETETEKRLGSLLLDGFRIFSVDNVNGELGGDLLCQAIERPLIRVRRLGESKSPEIDNRVTMFATGNGLRLVGDMARRTLLCNLDAGMERPELRTFGFDPVQRVLADRGRYVAACLTIVRAHLLDRSKEQLSPLASFGDWSDMVRSALVWLGCADPCNSMETAREDDPELSEIREVMFAWHSNLPTDERFSARRISEIAEERAFDPETGRQTERLLHPELREALLRIAGDRGTISTKRLGKWLLDKKGRIVDGRRIEKDGALGHGGISLWHLQTLTADQ